MDIDYMNSDYMYVDYKNKLNNTQKLYDINIQEIQDKEPFINRSSNNILFLIFFIFLILFILFGFFIFFNKN